MSVPSSAAPGGEWIVFPFARAYQDAVVKLFRDYAPRRAWGGDLERNVRAYLRFHQTVWIGVLAVLQGQNTNDPTLQDVLNALVAWAKKHTNQGNQLDPIHFRGTPEIPGLIDAVNQNQHGAQLDFQAVNDVLDQYQPFLNTTHQAFLQQSVAMLSALGWKPEKIDLLEMLRILPPVTVTTLIHVLNLFHLASEMDEEAVVKEGQPIYRVGLPVILHTLMQMVQAFSLRFFLPFPVERCVFQFTTDYSSYLAVNVGWDSQAPAAEVLAAT